MAKVPKTSGQGVSRKAYQNSYALGARGTGAPGKNALRSSPAPEIKGGDGRRKYDKGAAKKDPFTISYGSTLPISDLDDLKGFLK